MLSHDVCFMNTANVIIPHVSHIWSHSVINNSVLLTLHYIQVDHGTDLDRHLTFLVECRGAFSSMNDLKVFTVTVKNSGQSFCFA